MRYQFPDGTSIEITVEEYLSLSYEDLMSLQGTPYTEEINNPFHGSAMKGFVIDDDIDFEELSDDDILLEED